MIASLVDTRYLEAFLAVCEDGTLARAAVRLHKTQPALSYNLRRLEEAVGAPLFERSGRRLILTAQGRGLRQLAERYAAAFQDFRRLAGQPAVEQDRIRLASVSGFGRYVLYPRVRDLAADAAAPVVLLYRTAAEVMALVESGAADCGAVYHARVSNTLRFTPVYEEELVLIAPAGFRPPRAGWRALASYTEMPFVTYEESDYVFGRWFDRVFRRQPGSGRVRWHLTELEEVIDAVSHGQGVSIVPLDAVPAGNRGLRVIRPGTARCVNQVFRVERASRGGSALLERIFTGLSGRSNRDTREGLRRSPRREAPAD